MLPTCPHCGIELLSLSAELCPACHAVLEQRPGETGYTASPPVSEGSFAENSPPVIPADDVLREPRRLSGSPPCPPWLLVILSVVLCGWQGAMALGNWPTTWSINNTETLIGGFVGLVLGIGVAVDYWLLQARLKALDQQPREPEQPNFVERPSEWVSAIMLILPVAAAAATWFAQPLGMTQRQVAVVGSGAIVLTAVLAYVNIRQLLLRNEPKTVENKAMVSPAFAYLGLLGFWILCFPLHFVARWRMGGRNLVIPGLLATAAYCAPIFQGLLVEPDLPSADDAEVVALLQRLLEDEPMMKPVRVLRTVETSFDPGNQKRMCQCAIAAKFGEESVAYRIDWQDRKRGIWQVQLLDRLPLVTMPEVVNLLKTVIQNDQLAREGRIDVALPNIQPPTQTAYDPAKQRRTASTTVVSAAGREMRINFYIEWADAKHEMFRLEVFEKMP